MEGIINYLYSITGDLGVTIIFLTLSVKVIMLPLSIESKKSTLKQIVVSKKIEEIKKKFKNNKRRLEEEIKKLQGESMKSMGGCLLQFIQIPIVSFLYFSISNIPISAATIVVPWVESINFSDPFFIIPIIYVVVTLLPTILNLIRKEVSKGSPSTGVVLAIISFIITIKSPIALGLYFITSSIFTFIESEGFRLYSNRLNVVIN